MQSTCAVDPFWYVHNESMTTRPLGQALASQAQGARPQWQYVPQQPTANAKVVSQLMIVRFANLPDS